MTTYWYALYVPNGKEETIKQILDQHLGDHFRLVIYKRRLRERKSGKWHEVDRKLFPGYILLEGIMTEEDWYRIRNLQTGAKLLTGEDKSEWQTLTPQEVETLRMLDGAYTGTIQEKAHDLDSAKNNAGLVDISKIYVDKQEIKVVSGALMGLEGRIVSVNKRKGRAKVRLGFLGDERVVELGVEVLEKSKSES